MGDLIQNSEDLRKQISDALLQDITAIEKKILRKVLQLLDDYDSANGFFISRNTNAKKLLNIENEIFGILQDAGYFKAVNTYVADLRKITINTELLHRKINKIDIVNSSMTGIETAYAKKAVLMLAQGGLNVNFISPVTTVVNEAITFGYSIANTRDTLETMVIGNEQKLGLLNSYLTVTARDTVTQLQGAQHQKVLIDYEMPYIRYTGGLLKDSRGQCVRWRDMRYIEVKELQNELDLAYANQAQKLNQPKGHKWGAMIPGTTPENFCIRRGGWGCIHQAIPVRSKDAL